MRQKICIVIAYTIFFFISLLLASLFYFLITRLIFLIFFICTFSCFVCLFYILCFLCCCIVLCIIYPFLYSCLFPIFVQVHRPLPPGGNTVVVNKYHIVSYCEWVFRRFSVFEFLFSCFLNKAIAILIYDPQCDICTRNSESNRV